MRKNEKNSIKLWKIVLQIIMLPMFLMGTLAGCVNVPKNENQQEFAETETERNEYNETIQANEEFSMLGVPILTIETASANCYDVNGKLNAELTYDIVSLEGNGFETVAQAILEWNERDIGNLMIMGQEYTYDEKYTVRFVSSVECTRMDSSVISLRQQRFGTGEGYLGVNFDVTSGKKLVLSDILVDEEGFQEKITKPIIEKLQEVLDTDIFNGYETDTDQDWISEYIDISSMWYLDAVGIVFFFDSSEINPIYKYNSVTVTIPYEDVAECMKSEYCGIHGAGVARFPVNETVRVNLSEEKFMEKDAVNESSGIEILSWDTVMLAFEGDEEDWGWGGKAGIIINDRQEDVEAYYWIEEAYLLSQISGETYLLFDDENLDHNGCITYLYDITNGEIEKREEYGAWIVGKNVNVRSLTLGEIVEVFGTYFMTTPYSIRDESARFVRAEVRYNNSRNSSLNVIRDLPVVIDGEKTSLPPGSRIIITAIDDSKIAYFEEINSGIEGEIHYTDGDSGEGSICVDGVEESAYFEYLPYSG